MNFLLPRFYLYAVVPLLSIVALFAGLFSRKVRQGLEARNYGLGRKYPNISNGPPLYWFHCSSGEVEYVKSLIRQLKGRLSVRIVLTWHSPSVLPLVRAEDGIDFCVASPWENLGSYRQFLQHFQPQALFIARTDIWPAMLLACRKHQIPSYLVAATFVASSSRNRNSCLRAFYRWAHNLIDIIFCVSEKDRQLFLHTGYRGPLIVSGDTRVEQVLWKLQMHKAFPVRVAPSEDRKILVAGSTWPEDEAILLPSFLRLRHQLRMIIAPHDPTEKHLFALIGFCEKHNLSYQLLSQCHEFSADILIVDKVGVLASAYAHGDLAFIGGGCRGLVHSVLEGLAAGLVCFFGPHYQNNREAIHVSEWDVFVDPAFKLGQSVNHSEQLVTQIEKAIRLGACEQATKERVRDLVQSWTGSTEKILNALPWAKPLEPQHAP